MRTVAEIGKYQVTPEGTQLLIHIPRLQLGDMLCRKEIRKAEIRFDDGRHISAEQRKKAYATIRDIADYTGYPPEVCKELMKTEHIIRTGDEEFSLSNCSMDTAREFISTLIEFAIEWEIPLSGMAAERTDDIGRYLYFGLMHKKCAVCGKPGEIHHVDAIGMGRNRGQVDDSEYRKICLCRGHHIIAHQKGMEAFQAMYHVYGIVVKDTNL